MSRLDHTRSNDCAMSFPESVCLDASSIKLMLRSLLRLALPFNQKLPQFACDMTWDRVKKDKSSLWLMYWCVGRRENGEWIVCKAPFSFQFVASRHGLFCGWNLRILRGSHTGRDGPRQQERIVAAVIRKFIFPPTIQSIPNLGLVQMYNRPWICDKFQPTIRQLRRQNVRYCPSVVAR